MRLVADIGGTNTRVALADAGHVQADTVRSYVNAEWDNFTDVARDFLNAYATPQDMVIAVAGPVAGKVVRTTNHSWTLNSDDLVDAFGCDEVHFLNDLTALGYSVPGLQPSQLTLLSDQPAQQTTISQSLVVGIGTGINISPVLQSGGTVLCPAAEAGHMSMPYAVSSELAKLGLSPEDYPTTEDLFSGRGFDRFCAVLCNSDGRSAVAAYGSAKATRTVDAYAALVGWLLRDLRLAFLPTAGVYLAGSVARAVLHKAQDAFRAVQDQPLPLSFDASAPVWIIEDDSAALGGCARY